MMCIHSAENLVKQNFFDQVAIDAKSFLTFEIRALVSELK